MNQQVVYQDISQIHPYENNPRNNEAAVGPVAQSIKEFGFRVPILIDGKGTIIAGHTRYEAAKRLGMDKVPCIRVDDLTDAQIKAYRIADNKVAEASSWNDDVLRAEMDALQALDVDLSSTGFIGVELSMMVGAPFWLTSAGLFVGTFLAVELGNLMISKTALAKVV